MQAAGFGWAQPIACIKEFQPLALGTTPVILRIIRFGREKKKTPILRALEKIIISILVLKKIGLFGLTAGRQCQPY